MKMRMGVNTVCLPSRDGNSDALRKKRDWSMKTRTSSAYLHETLSFLRRSR